MTGEEIFNIGEWRTPELFVFSLHSVLWEKNFKVTLDFDPKSEQKEIKPNTLKSIQEFQNLAQKDLEDIQNAIWEYVQKSTSPFKISPDSGKTWKIVTAEEQLLDRGIRTKEDAIAKSRIVGVGFWNDEDVDFTYFAIYVRTDWDQEHGISILYYNGVLDCAQDG